jgi:hypothetical protein
MHEVISVLRPFVRATQPVPVVNRRGPRALRSDRHESDAAARVGGPLLTHGGGRDAGHHGHFLPPLADLVIVLLLAASGSTDAGSAAAASGFRNVGPTRASR